MPPYDRIRIFRTELFRPPLGELGLDRFDLPTDRRLVVFPGFCDVHVHLREPGFSYKETIAAGTRAAAHGGFTAVCAMPNLDPVPDSAEHLAAELALIKREAVVQVYPYGALTVGEKGREAAGLAAMASDVVGFSDDGRGVQDEDMMRRVMTEAARLGKPVACHCEAEELVCGGCVHDGRYAAAGGLMGISSESEWRQLERDIRLSAETGCAFHACHISCRESVELVRRAKARGLNVSCEVTPHHLLLDENDIEDDGRWKMKPPLRSADDRAALTEGLRDGTIDCIATDHAPHSAEEKAAGLRGSAFGVVGLESAFRMLYTELVQKDVISLERLIDLMSLAPRKRFGIAQGRDFTVWDLEARGRVDPADFLSMGKSTPFAGREVSGRCLLTVSGGRIAYRADC